MVDKKEKALVFFSGGMDSWAHLRWAQKKWGRENVHPMFIRFGHSYEASEELVARNLCYAAVPSLIVRQLDLHDQEDSVTHHLQMRNLFMLLLGSYYADNLVFGMLQGDFSEDKNPAFVRQTQRILRSQYVGNIYHPVTRKIKIWTPFASKTKSDMVRWYLDDGGDVDNLLATIGCYNAHSAIKQCGNCISCFHRWVALANNNLTEDYVFAPHLWFRQRVQETSSESIGKKLWWLLKKRKYFLEVYRALKSVEGPSVVSNYWRRWKKGDSQ